MRRARPLLAALLGALTATACAVIEPPPGGPEDRSPPRLLTSRPDTFAVAPDWSGPVSIVFDERISERGVQQAVDVSPRTSGVVVDHRGEEIRVSLRRGWEPGLIYHVQVLPGIQDLFNNPVPEPVRLVFSTGPAIPATRVAGEVVDPITGKPEEGARVEAIRLADSLVYAVPSDSAGRFRLSHLPEGEYRVRAYRDMNRNRELDAFEPRDSAVAVLTPDDTVSARLGILLPDTTPAVIREVRVAGGNLEIEFDDYLAPDQVLPPARVQILSAQGAFVPVQRIAVGALPAEAGPAGAPAPGAPADSARPALPAQKLVVELAGGAKLEPGATYRVTVSGVRNVVGLTGDAQGELKVPEDAAPPASAPGSAPAPTRSALPSRPNLEP